MLTPVDVKNHTFKISMGRYDKGEVDSFLDEVSNDFETATKENADLKNKVAELSTGIQYYKKMESSLQKALISAEASAEEKINAAQEEADKILASAEAEAKEKLDAANADADNINAKVQEQIDAATADATAEKESIIAAAKEEADNLKAEAEKMNKEAEEKLASATEESDKAKAEAKEEADKVISDAKSEADTILADAKAKSDSMLSDKTEELKEISAQIDKLKEMEKTYKENLKKLLQDELDAIESGKMDVEVPDLAASLSAAEELINKNSDLPTLKDRLNAFDDQSDLDSEGLNSSGLNFDVERSASGITIDDSEAVSPVVEEPKAEEEVKEETKDDDVVAGATEAEEENSDSYDAFANAPSFDNDDLGSSDSPFTFTKA